MYYIYIVICLSVCLSVCTFWHTAESIETELAQNESHVFKSTNAQKAQVYTKSINAERLLSG